MRNRALGFGHWALVSRGLAAGAWLVVLAATFTACGSMSMPSAAGLGRMGAAALPIGPEKEGEIGFGIAAAVAGRYPLAQDRALNEYVSMVGAAVAEQSMRAGEVDFRFGVLDTEDVNAFAAPGGYIFITRGALALMESESELAGVLAHEVAHVDEKHVLDDIRRADVMGTATDEAQLSGPLLDAISGAGASLLFTGLSRDDEAQADSLGMLYASAVGYRPDGMMQFLLHLDAAVEQQEGGVGEWVATHPPTTERVDRLRAQIAAAGLRADGGVTAERRFRTRTR